MLLDTLEKYYVSDTDMRNGVLRISFREDISRQIENIVYLELLRRGYEVTVANTATRRWISPLAGPMRYSTSRQLCRCWGRINMDTR